MPWKMFLKKVCVLEAIDVNVGVIVLSTGFETAFGNDITASSFLDDKVQDPVFVDLDTIRTP